MTDKKTNQTPDRSQDAEPVRIADLPAHPTRRGFLGSIAALGASAATMGALQGCSDHNDDTDGSEAAPQPPTEEQLTEALRNNVKTVVVIFAENRSFNNLFGNFPGVESPLSELRPEAYRQYDRDGTLLDVLPPVWGGMVPRQQTANHIEYQVLA